MGRNAYGHVIEIVMLAGSMLGWLFVNLNLCSRKCDFPQSICAGREDFDVRMLGNGRPFTLEFANSRPAMPGPDFFARAQEELNSVSSIELSLHTW